ncbi:MAG: DUF4382 domain-containing protein [Campylobacterales bacterium]|nr:DUF4382 domain-containing protein [Campylobacterales bacterium]
MKVLRIFTLIMVFVGAMALSSCGSSSRSDDNSAMTNGDTVTGEGAIALYLTDAPADYQAVYVSIKEIAVHVVTMDANGSESNASDDDASWQVIAQPNVVFNLLELQNGVLEYLGQTEVPAGKYTQLRLILADELNATDTQHDYANYVVFEDNSTQELKVPSGVIKLNPHPPIEVEANETINVIIDFDAQKSVNANSWNLKPVISVETPDDINKSKINSDDENQSE